MADILELVEREAGEEAGAGGIAVAHAYADWNRLGLEDYRRDVERDGVRTMQVFAAGAPTKNAADIELVVDCLRFATERDSIEVFVIVSGDGDFVPLVRRLHELGKYVVGATLAQHDVNSLLREEADLYVSIPTDTAKEAAKKEAAKKEQPRKQQAKKEPVAKEPATKPAAAKQPQKKAAKKTAKKAAPPVVEEPSPLPSRTPNWHDLAQDIGVVVKGPASSPQEYKDAIATLLETPKFHSYCDKLVARGGTLPLLAMAIRAAAPQLSPSAVGVRNLSRALRFALAGTRYALAQGDDDAQPVLVMRRSKHDDMLPDLSLKEIRR
jgi:outer membrane biosynthesis protein TonB